MGTLFTFYDFSAFLGYKKWIKVKKKKTRASFGVLFIQDNHNKDCWRELVVPTYGGSQTLEFLIDQIKLNIIWFPSTFDVSVHL